MKSKLYKLAIWYIGKCNSKWDKTKKEIKSLGRLTFSREKAYLLYGADAEWQNFSRYDVLDNAIQRLAEYESIGTIDELKEIRNKAIDEFAEKFVYKAVCEGCSGCCNCYEEGKQSECDDWKAYMEIAEQMKGV